MPKTKQNPAPALWSHPLRIDDIPEAGGHFALAAPLDVRTNVAAAAGLVALPRFEAAFEVTRRGSGGAHVIGRVMADIEQTCVVSLEPLQSRIAEPVDTMFVLATTPTPTEDVVAPEGDDQTLTDGSLDLGALAVEFLLLAIDPYPRKPEAVFAKPESDAPNDGAVASPFAALAALKKDDREKH